MSNSLDLSNVFDRDDVKLSDGTVYEIKNPEEFGILDDHRLDALMKRIEQAREKAAAEDATEEDAQNASGLLRELAALLLVNLPADAAVSDWESAAIFEFHMKKRIERARELAKKAGIKPPPPVTPRKKTTRRKSTTARSSRGSKRSTAARRKTG